MSAATGLDPIECAALATLRSLGATADQPHRRTALVLRAVEEQHGFAADDVHRRILDLSHDWETVLRTIDLHGNGGTRDFPAAAPRYTEVRLTALGLAAAEAEAGHGPPLPIGLVHGDLFKGGARPPLDPHRLLAGLRARRAGASDADAAEAVGLPSFPAGCVVEGDHLALHAGEPVRLRLRGVLEVTADRVVIRTLPPPVGGSEVSARLHDRSLEHPLRPEVALPIRDVHDASARGVMRIDVHPRPGTSPRELADLLAEVWGIEVLRDCALPRPLPTLLDEWLALPAAEEGLDRFEGLL